MAAPLRPPPTAMCLANLPDDVLVSILGLIPCKADRGRMSLVSKAWRAMLTRLKVPRPRPLPWLLLPKLFPDGSTHIACVLSGCRVHHYLTISPPEARCFGSHDGAWLFLHISQARNHHLFNLRTRRVHDLPGELLRWNHSVVDMVILTAALSSSPDDSNCFAAGIVSTPAHLSQDDGAILPSHRCVALWRLGWPRANEIPPDANQIPYHVEDVVFHDGAFHFLLAQSHHLLVCKPTMGETEDLTTNWELIRFHPGGGGPVYYSQYDRTSYLIESRGKLLLVVRFRPHHNQSFKVFLAMERKTTDTEAKFPVSRYPWSWSELDTLGGRMLFVGHGFSRSYESYEYPGFKDGIYFLDDGEFCNESIIFGTGNVRQYPCSSNGKWSEGHVQHCFPRPDPSNHSAPVWLLP